MSELGGSALSVCLSVSVSLPFFDRGQASLNDTGVVWFGLVSFVLCAEPLLSTSAFLPSSTRLRRAP